MMFDGLVCLVPMCLSCPKLHGFPKHGLPQQHQFPHGGAPCQRSTAFTADAIPMTDPWCWYICEHKGGILMGSMEHHNIAAPWIRHGIGICPVEIAKIGNTMIQQRMVPGSGIFRHGNTPQVCRFSLEPRLVKQCAVGFRWLDGTHSWSRDPGHKICCCVYLPKKIPEMTQM